MVVVKNGLRSARALKEKVLNGSLPTAGSSRSRVARIGFASGALSQGRARRGARQRRAYIAGWGNCEAAPRYGLVTIHQTSRDRSQHEDPSGTARPPKLPSIVLIAAEQLNGPSSVYDLDDRI